MSSFEGGKQPQRTHWSKEIYKAAELLYKSGSTLKEIESISGIPYTTLRGRLV